MIGIRETEMIYRLPPHYVNMLINSVVTKGGLRDKAPLIGSKIAKKRKLKGGIALLGARLGQGKTSTINIFVDTFEKDKSLSDFTIAYLNTKEIKEDGLNFIDKANKLMARISSDELLVIIDQIDCRESMQAGIMLAKAGYSVIGLVQVGSDHYISDVLDSAVKGTDSSYEKDLITGELLENLNALILQNQNYPLCAKYLFIDKKTAKSHGKNLRKKGAEYLNKVIIDGSKDLVSKEWTTKNWKKK